jgi:phenylalanyl-tRNA synthetase alpha chain
VTRLAGVSSIREQATRVEREALARVEAAGDERELDAVRVAYLGKKGELTALLRAVASLPTEGRPEAGRVVNESKTAVQNAIVARQARLGEQARVRELEGAGVDLTLPAFGEPPGHIHPLTQINAEISAILGGLGFSVAVGPEVEDDYHNFEALNIPADHPARDMQDTFFVRGGYVLRTHTSPVQIRVMETTRPPIAIIVPGAVYRHGDDDATHSPMFHQVEGLLIDRDVHFGHLKFVLTALLHGLFGAGAPVRFRPSYFPFTEPSAEVDVGCVICGGQGRRGSDPCRVCKGTGWLEILGAGMVDPAVFGHVGYDSEEYTGFAFGVGVERIAMLRYGIADIRGFFASDLRFLEQF